MSTRLTTTSLICELTDRAFEGDTYGIALGRTAAA